MENETLEYSTWLDGIKESAKTSQLRYEMRINRELLKMYWLLGKEMLEKEKTTEWGKKLIDRLPRDLGLELAIARGLSRVNLYRIKTWVEFYDRDHPEIPEVLLQVSWKYHMEIIDRCHEYDDAMHLIEEAWKHGWSYEELLQNIESLCNSEG